MPLVSLRCGKKLNCRIYIHICVSEVCKPNGGHYAQARCQVDGRRLTTPRVLDGSIFSWMTV